MLFIFKLTLDMMTTQAARHFKHSATHLSERLGHLPQEVFGELHGLVHSEVQTAVGDVLLDPARQLPTFVCSGVPLRRETSHTV